MMCSGTGHSLSMGLYNTDFEAYVYGRWSRVINDSWILLDYAWCAAKMYRSDDEDVVDQPTTNLIVHIFR